MKSSLTNVSRQPTQPDNPRQNARRGGLSQRGSKESNYDQEIELIKQQLEELNQQVKDNK